MASSEGYLAYVLDLLRDAPDITYRKMMGEYLLYASGKLFGGIYDDRFMMKDVPASRAVLAETDLPYDGAQLMRVVDTEDAGMVAALVSAMLPELPEPRQGK